MNLYANSIFYNENEKAGKPIDNLGSLGKALYDQENISDIEDIKRIGKNIQYNQSTLKGILNPNISPIDWFEVGYWEMATWPVQEFAAAKVLSNVYGKVIKPTAGAIGGTRAYNKVIDDVIPSAVKAPVAAVINKIKGIKTQPLDFDSQFKYFAAPTPAFLATEGYLKTQTDNPWVIYPASLAAGIAAPASLTPKVSALGKKTLKTVGQKAFDQVLKTKKINVDVGITSSVNELQGYTPFFKAEQDAALKKLNTDIFNGTLGQQKKARKKAEEVLRPAIDDLDEKKKNLDWGT